MRSRSPSSPTASSSSARTRASPRSRSGACAISCAPWTRGSWAWSRTASTLSATPATPITSLRPGPSADRGSRAAPPSGVPVKERDAVWTVFVVDPIAAPLAGRLRSARAVTPNRLTVGSVLVALGAAAAFALGPLWLGAVLFQVSFLLDCMDGKLASLRGRDDPSGALYDTIGDCVRLAA